MRSGVRLGVDVGKVRIGLAASDPEGLIASPVATIPRVVDGGDWRRVLAEATERQAVELVVGLPLSLAGTVTASTADAERFALELARGGTVPVRMVDERFTTVSAQSALHAAGRSVRSSRSVVDQVAAVILLQHALDAERAGGVPPGAVLDPS